MCFYEEDRVRSYSSIALHTKTGTSAGIEQFICVRSNWYS
jgi:hypothetical protein